MRICIRLAVRNIRHTRRVRKTHRHRNAAAIEDRSLAEAGSVWRCLEVPFGHEAFGMIGAKSRMDAEKLIHRVDDLGRNGVIVGESRDRRGHKCQRG